MKVKSEIRNGTEPAGQPEGGEETRARKRGLWTLLALAGGAVASFHLANSVPVCALAIVGFLACLVGLTRLGSARRAFNWGVTIGLAVYIPYLHFFWNVFVGPAANALEKTIAILGVCALWMVLPVWLGVFLALATFARQRLNPWVAMLMIPFLWTGIEYFRSELYPLRFSWLGVGYAFSALPNILSWTGVYGIGFLLCLVASTSLLSWKHSSRDGRIQFCGLGVLAVLAWAGFSATPPPSDRGIKVVGLQYEFAPAGIILQGLNAALRAHPDAPLFVLSENAFDGPVPDRVRQWCRENHRHLIAGGRAPLGETNFYNTAFVIGADGEVVFQQAKAQPVQFFKDGLPAPEQRVWDSPWGYLGLCICYDLSYTRVTDELIRQGAQAIICPTMDVETWGRDQHELHARIAPVRAAEYGVPIFRLASSGISQNIASSGHVLATAPFPGDAAMLAGRFALSAPGRLPLDRWLAPLSVAVTALGLSIGVGLLILSGTGILPVRFSSHRLEACATSGAPASGPARICPGHGHAGPEAGAPTTSECATAPGQRLFLLDSPQGWDTTKDYLSGRLLSSDDPPFGLSWKDLNEEMLFVTLARCSLAIDLGWYPDHSPEGQFLVEVVDLNNCAATYAKPLREFATRSVWVAKQKMEEWMEELHASPAGPNTTPKGGPATPLGKPGVAEEPPSVN